MRGDIVVSREMYPGPLPETFRYSCFHTLRNIVRGHFLSFFCLAKPVRRAARNLTLRPENRETLTSSRPSTPWLPPMAYRGNTPSRISQATLLALQTGRSHFERERQEGFHDFGKKVVLYWVT